MSGDGFRHRSAAEDSKSAGSDHEADAPTTINHVSLRTAPLKTLYLFALVIVDYAKGLVAWVLKHQVFVLLAAFVAAVVAACLVFPGHQDTLRDTIVYETLFVAYWVLLGVASSIGLGSGLHTFLLFLGPHIIRVSIRAGTCDSVDFSARLAGYLPYTKYTEDAWKCQSEDNNIGLLQVVAKVLYPAALWGFGTAIGELPPYFMARAARLSGEMLKELQEIEEEEELEHPEALPLMERAKMFVHTAIQRWGFWAILVAASIPNPLFDLAGITCGHFLVPFWTFFGATAIGKGCVKVSLQAVFYVVVFSPVTLDKMRELLPFDTVHAALDKASKAMSTSMSGSCWKNHEDSDDCQECCKDLFPGSHNHAEQYRNTCAKGCDSEHKAASFVGFAWNMFIMAMLAFFLVSIINASANEKLVELEQTRRQKHREDTGSKPVRVRPTDETADVNIMD